MFAALCLSRKRAFLEKEDRQKGAGAPQNLSLLKKDMSTSGFLDQFVLSGQPRWVCALCGRQRPAPVAGLCWLYSAPFYTCLLVTLSFGFKFPPKYLGA